jgi:uroporphyrinogen decarboxylase
MKSKGTMNSKERVLTAFAHRQPDRVPLDYSANPGIDRRLKAHFGLEEGDHEGLLQALGVDFRSISAPYIGPRLFPPALQRHVDPCWGTHTRWVEHSSGGYWDYCDFPLKTASLEQVEAWPMPSPEDFDYHQVTRACRELADYCLVAGDAGQADILNSTGMLRSVEQVYLDLASGEPAFLRYVERKCTLQLEVLRRTLVAGGGAIDLLWLGEDLGHQRGPLISLRTYRQYLRPWHQRFVDLGKEFGLLVVIHSCGSSSWVYEDFIEMGIQVVDTLQPEARDMAPAYLKARYGEKLAFHGCISTAGVVAFGSPAEVTAEVRATLEVMMPGGGYALSPTHMLQDNSPTENVLALYRAAQEFGSYR